MKRPKRLKSYRCLNEFQQAVDAYFETCAQAGAKSAKVPPPTLMGLGLHLGFTCKDDFENYEINGKYAWVVKQGRFKILAYYESRLLLPAPTGAIFALKSMGWEQKTNGAVPATPIQNSLNIKLIESGPQPVSSEKEVKLEKQPTNND